eukprot:312169-Pyramimonas_sp.AAC.1
MPVQRLPWQVDEVSGKFATLRSASCGCKIKYDEGISNLCESVFMRMLRMPCRSTPVRMGC